MTNKIPKTQFEKMIWRWVQFSCKHSLLIVVTFLLLSAIAGFFATRIRIDANLESMLPKKSKTIEAMNETRRRYGSSDLFTLAFVMKDPLQIAKIQDEISEELTKKWPDVVTVQIERDGSFFKKHALLYIPVSELKNLITRLKSKRDEYKLGPLGVDIFAEAPVKKNESIIDENSIQKLGLPDEAAEQFKKFLKSHNSSDSSLTGIDYKQGIPDSLKNRLIGRLDDGRYVGVVQAVLKKPSSDVEYAKTVFTRSNLIIQKYKKKYGSDILMGIKGPYKSLNVNSQSLGSNGTIATVISVILTLIIIMMYFRSTGPIFLVLGQAAISCLFTLGFVSLSYARLNLYTMFVIAILFGMGTDFSLYVMGYAQREFRKGSDWQTSLYLTLTDMASSLFSAWITTVAGLLTLLTSRFAGFYEFGLIATIGMTFSLVLTYLFLPSAIMFVENLSRKPLLGWIRIEPKKVEAPSMIEPSWLKKTTGVTAAIAIVGSLLLLPFAKKVQFEYDFTKLGESQNSWTNLISRPINALFSSRDLNSADDLSKIPISVALGTGRSSSQPVVLMADNPGALAAIYDTLQYRLTVEHDPQISSFLMLKSFVPSDSEQKEKLPYLKEINSILSDKIFDKASGKDSILVATIRDMSNAQLFKAQDIPSWALDLLRERDGNFGKIGFVYCKFNTSDASEAQKFENRYNGFKSKSGDIQCYSSSFVYADLVRFVREDSMRMSFLMLGILCALLAIIIRKPKAILVCFIVMAVSILWIFGLLGLFHQKVSVFNLIVITTIQAALTDVVIYVVLAWERQNRQGLVEIYKGIGVLMSVAIGTTIAGYAGMIFTSHLGIQSMGTFATISLGACLATSLCLTPWLCAKMLKSDENKTDISK